MKEHPICPWLWRSRNVRNASTGRGTVQKRVQRVIVQHNESHQSFRYDIITRNLTLRAYQPETRLIISFLLYPWFNAYVVCCALSSRTNDLSLVIWLYPISFILRDHPVASRLISRHGIVRWSDTFGLGDRRSTVTLRPMLLTRYLANEYLNGALLFG